MRSRRARTRSTARFSRPREGGCDARNRSSHRLRGDQSLERARGFYCKTLGLALAETYPGMDQDSLGIWTSPVGARVAWFKDPDGNTLSLAEFASP